jgi:hypothetical protein
MMNLKKLKTLLISCMDTVLGVFARCEPQLIRIKNYTKQGVMYRVKMKNRK